MSENQVKLEITAEDLASAVIAGITTAFTQMKTDLQNIAPAAKQAGDAISQAFSNLGIKSTKAIRAEQEKLIADFQRIKSSGTASAEDVARAQNSLRVKLAELEEQATKTGAAIQSGGNAMSASTTASKGMFDIVGGLALRFNALVTVAGQAWDVMLNSIKPALAMEKLNAMLRSATGSAEEAGVAYQFIRQEANRLGLDIETSAKSFAKFAASARGTSLEGEGIKKVFTGVAEAGTAMKLSTEEMDGIFLALSQSMSKGVLQAEEIRGQLSERLPGAYKILADAMGLTEQELGKQMEMGQILATDALPKLAAKMHEVYGPAAAQAAQDTTANFARLKNEVFEQAAAFGKDLLPAITVVLSALSGGIQVVGAMIKMFKDLSSIVFAAGFAMAEFSKLTLGGGLFSPEGRKEFEEGMISIKDTLMKQLNDMGSGQDKYYKSEAKRKEEAAEMDKRRLEEAKKALEANKKAQSDYTKTIADEETRLTAKYKQEYDDKQKTISAYYEYQLKAVVKGGGDEIRLNSEKHDALAKLERERSTGRAQIAIEVRETSLKLMATQMQAEIALVETKLAKQEISERDGAAQISVLRKQQADEELKLAEQRVSILTVAGLKGTEEYRKALDQQVKAQKEVNSLIMSEIKSVEAFKKASLDTQLASAQNTYKADLLALQEAETSGTKSKEQANLDRLKLERDYADQLVSIRAQQLSEINPETQQKEYEAALSAKLDADKTYLSAKQAVLNQEAKDLATLTATHADDLKKRTEAERAALANSQAFASAWFGSWDAAYNKATSSLQGLSDAAYNTFATMEKLPLKTADSLDTLSQKAEEASRDYADLMTIAETAGLKAGAAWFDSVKALNMIPAEVARITAEYYKQAAAAETLSEALDDPKNTTGAFAAEAERAMNNLNLLNKASLDTLKTGIDRIKNAMQTFTDQVKASLKSLQDDWDNMSMSNIQLEEKRYQEERLKWAADYKAAQEQQNQEAIKALNDQLNLIEKIHDATKKDLLTDPTNSVVPKMATGGNVGGSGTGDNQLRWLDPREWVMRPEAVSHWGSNVMAAINSPWSNAGQQLSQRLAGLNIPAVSLNMPRLAMATGGNVGTMQQSPAPAISLTINTTQPVDDTFIRRKIIPELERYGRLKA